MRSTKKRVWLPDRPGYGNPSEWLPLGHKWSGRQVRSERHQRVEATEKESGIYVRCHDCGAMAREDWKRHEAIRAKDDGTFHSGAIVRPARDPLPWALDRLDHRPCEPLGQLAITSGGAS